MSHALTALVHQAASDGVFAAVLAAFVSSIAYLHRPRLKALVYSLPVPFTCAYLATRMPVNATHVSGLALVVLYNCLLYVLRRKLHINLFLSIAIGVGIYIGGGILFRLLARTPIGWTATVFLLAWIVLLGAYRPIHEPGHRSPSPWWLKAPLVFVLSLIIYRLTGLLGGGVVTFPYAGVFTSYEMRHSLRTLAGQFAVNSLAIWSLIVTIALLQNHWPHPWPLVSGLAICLLVLGVIHGLKLGEPRPATAPSNANGPC